MAFVPLEKARVEHCIRATQAALHPAVQERLQDVLAIAADTIASQKVCACAAAAAPWRRAGRQASRVAWHLWALRLRARSVLQGSSVR